ncbi:type A chloramphenicol O-acetyltransferase [Proteus alimentorum]|uniref:Chloramphenicol acetyltransferase n=1 Tax=Proteus alimentorum TaxID=1973495 RepID=A0ABS0IRI8_9GAMM|nr:type A chloramphenicol O-acetyltransferase [Proteus alimentorum]MBG2874999.1 type A chloramphenicol O-acetyltransferase [Proteus alimentorum]MBG2878620.1 type A chloramphenicol O-acetyltransferase [Proteus alimentorum]
MNYEKINLEQWNRKEHFLHYRHNLQCGFSLTTKVDITTLKAILAKNNIKLYPAMIYLITKTVNSYPESRMAIKDNELVIWDYINPAYTFFHPKTETFSELWSEYFEDWYSFSQEYNQDYQKYKDNLSLSAKANFPENHFCISMIPWVSFDGFNLNVANVKDYFPPIFTMGKYTRQRGKILLPISIQVHHATCDGFHIARMVNKLQDLCDNFSG